MISLPKQGGIVSVPKGRWVAILMAASIGCGAREAGAPTSDSSGAPAGVSAAQVDPARALDLGRYLAEDKFKSLGGTCIRTDPEPGKSRLIYAILPAEASYMRLNVVSADGKTTELIELVRGVGGGRIWTGMTHAVRGQLGPVVTELFASANDHTPSTIELSADGPAGQLLKGLADAAMRLPCGPATR